MSNFTFGIALRCYFPDGLWQQITNRPLVFGIGEQTPVIDLAPLVRRMSNSGERIQLIDEYEKSLRRTLLREGYEVILDYCGGTNQLDKYKAEPWFQFVRIMRNVVSHKEGGILREWPINLMEKCITSVAWRNRVLGTSMVGQVVDFTPAEALTLFYDQMDFVHFKLT